MKFKVISHDYRNTGGNMMVSVFQIYLVGHNRTVFVNCSEDSATMTTADYINNFDPDDFDEVVIETVDFTSGMSAEICTYYDVFVHCLYEWLKSDCKHYGYRFAVDYKWLPTEVQVQISDVQRMFVEDELSNNYETDGYCVYVPTPDGDDDEILINAYHKPLRDTLAACLGRLTDTLNCNGEVMTQEDLRELRATIQDVSYYLYKND